MNPRVIASAIQSDIHISTAQATPNRVVCLRFPIRRIRCLGIRTGEITTLFRKGAVRISLTTFDRDLSRPVVAIRTEVNNHRVTSICEGRREASNAHGGLRITGAAIDVAVHQFVIPIGHSVSRVPGVRRGPLHGRAFNSVAIAIRKLAGKWTRNVIRRSIPHDAGDIVPAARHVTGGTSSFASTKSSICPVR